MNTQETQPATNNQPSYYAIIPAPVRYDPRLTPHAKLLFGEITALTNKTGHCYATNAYFSNLYGVTNTSVSKWISQLVAAGYVTAQIKYKPNTKEIEARYLSITPPQEILHPSPRKVVYPPQEKLNTPPQEKLKDNITSNEYYKKNSLQKKVFDIKDFEIPSRLAGSTAFMTKLAALLDEPKWRVKSKTAIQNSINQLSGFRAGFCILLIDTTISNNYQGLVFPETAKKYQDWLIQQEAPKPDRYPELRSTRILID